MVARTRCTVRISRDGGGFGLLAPPPLSQYFYLRAVLLRGKKKNWSEANGAFCLWVWLSWVGNVGRSVGFGLGSTVVGVLVGLGWGSAYTASIIS